MINRIFIAIELLLFGAALYLAIQWVMAPNDPFEPKIAVLGIMGAVLEFVRERLFARTQENETAIEAAERAREEFLQQYLDQMQELISHGGLLASNDLDTVSKMARARTLTVLRSLDGSRKGMVIKFLFESGLISIRRSDLVDERARVSLKDADLQNVNLSNVNLGFVDLRQADLTKALLTNTYLGGAKLTSAKLRTANLNSAYLVGADLVNADLTNASLDSANLGNANLVQVNLTNARGITNKQLAHTRSLLGATMPDGTVMAADQWEKFREHHRKNE